MLGKRIFGNKYVGYAEFFYKLKGDFVSCS
jgi:hypothetical protein